MMKRIRNQSFVLLLGHVFSNLNNTPGIVPEDPAVGVAQMIPIAAFTSLVATAP